MAAHEGPRIVKDGLVLALDAGNIKSYPGEPTTNLHPQGELQNIPVGNTSTDYNSGWQSHTKLAIESVPGPFGAHVNCFTQELLDYIVNPHMEGAIGGIPGCGTVGFTLIAGTEYCISVYVKANGTLTSANRLYITGASGNISSANTTLTPEWTRISKTFTPTVTGLHYLSSYSYNAPVGYKTYFTCYQVEQKGHPTQFVNGTRSATAGWKDLSGSGNNGNLDNCIYDSTAQITFNGVAHKVVIPHNANLNLQTMTIEAWIKPTATRQAGFIFEKGAVNTQYSLFLEITNVIFRHTRSSDSVYDGLTFNTSLLSTTNWNHLVATYTPGAKKVYLNAVEKASSAYNEVLATSSVDAAIGAFGGSGTGYPFDGSIGLVKIYNRALSAAEVLQNFNSVRGRFGV